MKKYVRSKDFALALMLLFSGPPALADFPVVSISSPSEASHPGEFAQLTYAVRWTGALDEWRIPAPSLEQPEWGRALLRGVKTYQDGESIVAEFQVAVTSDESGLYEFPSQSFSVYAGANIPRNESAPLKRPPESWIATDVIRTDPITVKFVPDYRGAIAAGVGAAVAAGLLGFFGLGAVRSRGANRATTSPALSDDSQELVHAARKSRLDGDFYGFFQALERAAGRSIGPEAAKLGNQFRERARDVGYGGVRPTDDEMDAALKDTERLIAASRR